MVGPHPYRYVKKMETNSNWAEKLMLPSNGPKPERQPSVTCNPVKQTAYFP